MHYPSVAPATTPAAEAAAAAAAASHIYPNPSAGMMYSHYHGHPFRFRRFGLFRRFFWFGAGAAVATWYYNKQQRLAAHAAGMTSATDPARGNGTAPAPGLKDQPWSGWHQSWHAKHDRDHHQYQPAQQQQIQPAVTGIITPVPAAAQTAQPEQMAHERQWGWRARRREQRERDAAQQAAVAAESTTSAANAASALAAGTIAVESDDMTRIREAVDRLYAEKMRDMKSMQEQANDKAKEFAKDKIDQLSVALETLRQSLKKDDEIKAAVEKKLV